MTKQISTTDYADMRGWKPQRVTRTIMRKKFLAKVIRATKVGNSYALEVDADLSTKSFEHYRK